MDSMDVCENVNESELLAMFHNNHANQPNFSLDQKHLNCNIQNNFPLGEHNVDVHNIGSFDFDFDLLGPLYPI